MNNINIKDIKIITVGPGRISYALGIKPETYASLNQLAKNINPDTLEVNAETILDFFNAGGILVYAETLEGKIVGIVTMVYPCKINGSTARVEHVSVLPDFWGNGIAGRMLTVLIDESLRSHPKVKRIDLTCDPENKAANRLYEKFGFKVREGSHQMRLVLGQ